MRLPTTAAHPASLADRLVVDVLGGWRRRDLLHAIARIAEGSA